MPKTLRMLDLFCGRFGWGKVFSSRGWEVVGVDLVEPPEVPAGCEFIQRNILTIESINPLVIESECPACQGTGNYYRFDEDSDYLPCDECEEGKIVRKESFDFICASSPCEQFSVHGMKCFHPNPPYPELGIKLFNHTRALCESSGLPYVMENVRAAQKFVGIAVHHAGPFYLWGNAVPPLMPQGISKGTKLGLDKNGTREERKKNDMYYKTGSKSKARANHIALVAAIPEALAHAVAAYAERIIQ